ncbi:acyl-CoA thioesterase-2 [Streptoalloteichus tenebrarius]|uniref:Acyl-CoA thioesterase-2 n=1 Tax=Streptoalloteichus tenebrarius (strain ATCC 17920 / DSM 40477 / JCM 4838 / CBS 697.72 / NBRC 16177 / NCIMB 11028 / NRRL B-12390 / A12253. 1 / ISP 5477) TaxID=1933 RepID=A0ABT1I357_STRSD|nr:acyl-CoA thioesterase-2 [Streptoalloteichus tenebrarius]BFF00034.1 acyl-CoA thioesterase II [Streptoalloteichus tenebrarius]
MTEVARAAAADPAAAHAPEPVPLTPDGVPHGQPVLDRLVALLDLERIEENIFRGVSPAESPVRVFGGQVAGQALVAAGRTVPADRKVHSLHAYFIRGGDPSVPIVYEVDRIRDGRSFTTRRVVAVQRGKAIFALSASFQLPESGMDHAEPMPEVPDPETLPTYSERIGPYRERLGWFANAPRPIDVRYVTEPAWVSRETGPREARNRVWMRADGRLPDDDLLHVCLLAYASDMTLLDSVLARHAVYWGTDKVIGASLDHAMWFHRPFRADDWFLYDCESPSASGARGLATGRFFSRNGSLVATVVQEGLLRVIP